MTLEQYVFSELEALGLVDCYAPEHPDAVAQEMEEYGIWPIVKIDLTTNLFGDPEKEPSLLSKDLVERNDKSKYECSVVENAINLQLPVTSLNNILLPYLDRYEGWMGMLGTAAEEALVFRKPEGTYHKVLSLLSDPNFHPEEIPVGPNLAEIDGDKCHRSSFFCDYIGMLSVVQADKEPARWQDFLRWFWEHIDNQVGALPFPSVLFETTTRGMYWWTKWEIWHRALRLRGHLLAKPDQLNDAAWGMLEEMPSESRVLQRWRNATLLDPAMRRTFWGEYWEHIGRRFLFPSYQSPLFATLRTLYAAPLWRILTPIVATIDYRRAVILATLVNTFIAKEGDLDRAKDLKCSVADSTIPDENGENTSLQGRAARPQVEIEEEYSLRKKGEIWDVTFGAEKGCLKDRKGLRDIIELFRAPGRRIPALDLIQNENAASVRSEHISEAFGDDGIFDGYDFGSRILDPEARNGSREGIAELEETIRQSEDKGDVENTERLKEIRRTLTRQSDKLSDHEKQKKRACDTFMHRRGAVVEAARKAELPEFSDHISGCIKRISGEIVYTPESPISWILDED